MGIGRDRVPGKDGTEPSGPVVWVKGCIWCGVLDAVPWVTFVSTIGLLQWCPGCTLSHAWPSGQQVLDGDWQGHVLEDEQLVVVHQLGHSWWWQCALCWVHPGSLEELVKAQHHPEDTGGGTIWDGCNEVGQFHLGSDPFVEQGMGHHC